MFLPLKRLVSRGRAWMRRPDIGREIEEELQFHLEMRARENVALGMTEEEARADAARRFGDYERIREACLEVKDHQSARRGAVLPLVLTCINVALCICSMGNPSPVFIKLTTSLLAVVIGWLAFSIVQQVRRVTLD